MSIPPAKRQRVESAQGTLLKPFRSPFPQPGPLNEDVKLRQRISFQSAADDDATLPSPPPAESSMPSRTSSIIRKYNQPRFSSAVYDSDSEVASLIKRQRELERRVSELKECLHLAEQARKIETDSIRKAPGGKIDNELLDLIQKWKALSQEAAEELFSKVRDRVNRLGGPRAWKDMQKRQQDFQQGYDEGAQPRTSMEEQYAEYNIEYAEAYKDTQTPSDEVEEGEEDDELTLTMMLKLLNIDFATIGYDRNEQRWTT